MGVDRRRRGGGRRHDRCDASGLGDGDDLDELGLILGSMFKSDEAGAKRLGWALRGMNGLVFGLVYGVVWWALDPSLDSAWWIGLLFGLLHGGIAAAAMPMRSAMHPRVRPGAASGDVVLPRFGFGGSGFGSMTPLGILAGTCARVRPAAGADRPSRPR